MREGCHPTLSSPSPHTVLDCRRGVIGTIPSCWPPTKPSLPSPLWWTHPTHHIPRGGVRSTSPRPLLGTRPWHHGHMAMQIGGPPSSPKRHQYLSLRSGTCQMKGWLWPSRHTWWVCGKGEGVCMWHHPNLPLTCCSNQLETTWHPLGHRTMVGASRRMRRHGEPCMMGLVPSCVAPTCPL